jgi:PEP-CTERM motif-containing protein
MRREIISMLFCAALVIASTDVRADTLSTTPDATNVTLGASFQTLQDSATLSGGVNPTGTITFTLLAPPLGAVVDTETVSVNGNGTYTTPTGYTLPTNVTVTGIYFWHGIYSGDGVNSQATSTPETVNINPASPKISTVPGGTVILGSGGRLTDTATLSGGYFETGLLTFTLEAPDGSTVDTETVTVSGNGTYSTPTGYVPPNISFAIGTYQWDAVYSSSNGNNNNAFDINDPSETENVFPTSPVPEPSTLSLIGTGFCAGLGVLRRRLVR